MKKTIKLCTNPLMVLFWFVLSNILESYGDYLTSETKYYINVKLLAINSGFLLIISWLSQLVIAQKTDKKAFTSLLGIISFHSVLLNISFSLSEIVNFNFSINNFEIFAILIVIISFILFIGLLLKDYLDKDNLNYYKFLTCFPAVFAALFLLFNIMNFFDKNNASIPNYSKILLEKTLFSNNEISIDDYLIK